MRNVIRQMTQATAAMATTTTAALEAATVEQINTAVAVVVAITTTTATITMRYTTNTNTNNATTTAKPSPYVILQPRVPVRHCWLLLITWTIMFLALQVLLLLQISACIWKWVYRDFGAPLIEIFLFGPLYSPWKKMKNDLLGGSNQGLLILLQWLRPAVLIGWAIFKNYGEMLFYNTNYAFDCCKWVREAFLPFFFFLKEKVCPARKKAGKLVLFIFFIFSPYSAPTAARRHSLVPPFQAYSVILFNRIIRCEYFIFSSTVIL